MTTCTLLFFKYRAYFKKGKRKKKTGKEEQLCHNHTRSKKKWCGVREQGKKEQRQAEPHGMTKIFYEN